MLRSRGRIIVLALAVAAACVAFAARDTVTYLYHVWRFRSDPAALGRSLFLDAGTAKGRAARRSVAAAEREMEFAKDVSGRHWLARITWGELRIIGPSWRELDLSADALGTSYGLRLFQRGGAVGTKASLTLDETRTVTVWGPFLLDANDPGRVDTWAVVGGKLVLPALVRITPRAWLSLSSTKFETGEVRHWLHWFSFDAELETGRPGRCQLGGNMSNPSPVIRSDAPDIAFGTPGTVPCSVEEDPGSESARLLVTVSGDPPRKLHLDAARGVGWLEGWGWGTILFDEVPPAPATK